jgi:hypothetical protein
MADNSKDVLYGFGIGSVVVVSVLTLALIIAFAYFLNIKDIITYIYNNISIFFTLFFVNNTSIPESDICSIVPSDKNVPRIPSLFTAHVSFFFGFLLANAIYLYEYKNDDTTGMENYLNNRKYRVGTSIFLLLAVFLFILFVRYKTTNCESLAGILFTTFIFGGLGHLWYKIGEICGLKVTDIFGITQSIMPKTAQAPLVCA